MKLIQTCIIHYCFLVNQEFNNFIKLDVIFGFFIFNFHPTGVIYLGRVIHFFSHINLDQKIILMDIYNYRKRQMLTQLFQNESQK